MTENEINCRQLKCFRHVKLALCGSNINRGRERRRKIYVETILVNRGRDRQRIIYVGSCSAEAAI